MPPALEARPIGDFLASERTCLRRVRIGAVHVLRSGAVILESAAGIHVTRPPRTWEMLRAHAERLTGPLLAPRMFSCGICILGGWFITDRARDAATGEIWLTMANIMDGAVLVLSGDVIAVLNM